MDKIYLNGIEIKCKNKIKSDTKIDMKDTNGFTIGANKKSPNEPKGVYDDKKKYDYKEKDIFENNNTNNEKNKKQSNIKGQKKVSKKK